MPRSEQGAAHIARTADRAARGGRSADHRGAFERGPVESQQVLAAVGRVGRAASGSDFPSILIDGDGEIETDLFRREIDRKVAGEGAGFQITRAVDRPRLADQLIFDPAAGRQRRCQRARQDRIARIGRQGCWPRHY